MPKPNQDCPRCGDSSWNGHYCKRCGYDHKHEELPPNDRQNPQPIKRR